MTIKSFKLKNTGLCSWIVKNCEKKNIIYATSIQQTIIPSIISGKDSLLFSRTGTGKTLSFILPLIHIHYLNPQNCFISILVPTKELGIQIYQTYNLLSKGGKIFGVFIDKKTTQFIFNIHSGICLISTILSLHKISNFLSRLFIYSQKVFILDEVDILMKSVNFGFLKKIILKILPSQINLFGVTNISFFKFLKRFSYRKNIFFFNEKQKKFNIFSEIKHEYIYCLSKFKFKFLLTLLKLKEKYEKKEIQKKPILIFFRDKKKCETFFKTLKENRISASILHHEMDFFQRTVSIQLVKKGIINILISTDLGSRGMNFSFVNQIINMDVPNKIKTYLHRSGRIGRFNKKGNCLNLVDKKEIYIIHRIEKNLGIYITKSNLNFKKTEFQTNY